MKLQQSLSFLLAAIILASFAGCNSDGTLQSSASSTENDSSSAEILTGRDAVADGLPERNFGNEKFTILTRTQYDYEFGVNVEDGELMNDAVYRRNLTVEERFGVDIVTVPTDCVWGEQATAFNTMLQASIMAADGAFDLVAGYAATIPEIVGENLFMNLAEIDIIDFSKPWWSELLSEELTINGKCFLATGDISLSLWQGMNCIFFNKRLADEYHIGNLYSLVTEGEWTLDKLMELTAGTYEDINGDTAVSPEDKYGFLCMRNTEIDNMKEAFELRVTDKGADGFPKLVYKNERTVEIVTRLNAYLHESDSVFFATSGNAAAKQEMLQMFSDGRGLFYASTVGKAEPLRSMNDDFGILPYPKYDSVQKDYHSTSLDEFSLFVIPIDAKNPEKSAIITEALCAESYKQVVPVFYETALKTKGARDDDSSAMIDLIRDGLSFDFGYLHSNALGGVGHRFVNSIRNNNNNVISDYDSKASGFEESLQKVLEPYR